MVEQHTELDLEYDRKLLEDVFDVPNLRYVSLYLFAVRKQLFQDLLDDSRIEEFDILVNLRMVTKADLQRICSQEFIRDLIEYRVIRNVYDYEIYKIKPNNFKISLNKGLKLAHEDISESMEEVHIFCTGNYIEKLIRKDMPEVSGPDIHTALERMRAMMCPVSSTVHELIHKYDENYVLDDDFYYIIEDLGNPFQALRIELMIRAMSSKYEEIEQDLDKRLKLFHTNLPQAKFVKKFRKIIEIMKKEHVKDLAKIDPKAAKEKIKDVDIDVSKVHFAERLKERIREETLPIKFRLDFSGEEDEGNDKKSDEIEEQTQPEIYLKWKKAFNQLIRLKLEFDSIDKDMDQLRAYYSGKNQVMPYMEFIEKATFNEDNIADNIRDLLLEARNSLKKVSDGCDLLDPKELKLLNLDLERKIIEEGWDEEDE